MSGSNEKKLNIKVLSSLVTTNFVLLAVIGISLYTLIYLEYMMGYSDSFGIYAAFFMLFPFIALAIVGLALLRYLFVTISVCRKYGKVNFIYSVVLFAITSSLIYFSSYFHLVQLGFIHVTNGYNARVEELADIEEIVSWLKNYDITESDTSIIEGIKIPSTQWPSAILELLPSYVYLIEIDSVKYVRVIHGGPLSGRFGLVVMEKPVFIPFDEFHTYEHRIQIRSDAFVWYQLKRVPKYAEGFGYEELLKQNHSIEAGRFK